MFPSPPGSLMILHIIWFASVSVSVSVSGLA
jgi:hypothetical protein